MILFYTDVNWKNIGAIYLSDRYPYYLELSGYVFVEQEATP